MKKQLFFILSVLSISHSIYSMEERKSPFKLINNGRQLREIKNGRILLYHHFGYLLHAPNIELWGKPKDIIYRNSNSGKVSRIRKDIDDGVREYNGGKRLAKNRQKKVDK